MEPTVRPRIKICCIASRAEAQAAIRAGASALGLVSAMPSGPGIIADALIAEIARSVPPPIATFLLTSRTDTREIIAQQAHCRANTIQIVDRLERGTHADLRQAMPGIHLVQVIHVTGEESLDEAVRVAPQVDALLLDSGNPSLAVKELGGTGRRHNWEISRRIRAAVEAPVFLAGGLKAENAAEAIAQVGPFGLDICSGVRTNGSLDEDKLAAFMKAAGIGA
ncbi:MAG: phosphoribosylanthranilate isomerase [Chloroflexi bacterium]|nr:phosphoribosylanthranilate isomerase [Chloroflexota bacterium]